MGKKVNIKGSFIVDLLEVVDNWEVSMITSFVTIYHGFTTSHEFPLSVYLFRKLLNPQAVIFPSN